MLSVGVNKVLTKLNIPFTETYADIDKIPSLEIPIPGLVMLDYFILHKARNVNEAKWWHGSLIFDDFVGKQVVHVSATSVRSGAERVSMRDLVLRNTFSVGNFSCDTAVSLVMWYLVCVVYSLNLLDMLTGWTCDITRSYGRYQTLHSDVNLHEIPDCSCLRG